MRTLHKLLSDSAKERRHNLNVLSFQITFMSWIVEFISILLVVIAKLIVPDKSVIFNFILDQVMTSVFGIILPLIFLINDSDIKENIVESKWYIAVLKVFGVQYNMPIEENDGDNDNNTLNTDSPE